MIGVVDVQTILASSVAGALAREILESTPEAGSATQQQRHQALLAMVGQAIVQALRRKEVRRFSGGYDPSGADSASADVLPPLALLLPDGVAGGMQAHHAAVRVGVGDHRIRLAAGKAGRAGNPAHLDLRDARGRSRQGFLGDGKRPR
jgi:hypothetical protein